jgi:hypothetical protein
MDELLDSSMTPLQYAISSLSSSAGAALMLQAHASAPPVRRQPAAGGEDGQAAAGGVRRKRRRAAESSTEEEEGASASRGAGASEAAARAGAPLPPAAVERPREASSRKGSKKNSWSAAEDVALRATVALLQAGVEEGKPLPWSRIDKEGLLEGRNAKQCRDRWVQHLKGGILKGVEWSTAEDAVLYAQMELHGSKWATIAAALPGRTDHDAKNRWYSTLRKMERREGRARGAS